MTTPPANPPPGAPAGRTRAGSSTATFAVPPGGSGAAAGVARPPAAPAGHVPEAGGAAKPDGSRDRRAPGLTRLVRGRWLRTIPGRVRALVALVLIALAVMLAVLTVAVGHARDSVQTIGHDAGPQVVTTGTLFFSLSDMDAQVANLLLIGREHDLGIGREGTLDVYERRRTEASAAAVQASQLAGRDPHLRQRVQALLDGLGRYEQMVGEAMLLDRQSAHAAGEPPKQVVELYRQASELMKLELLPQAYNLTLDSGAAVRQSYETKRSSVLSGRVWVAVTGAVLLILLSAVQIYLARGFRRLVNPALALATVAAAVLAVAGFGQLSAQADHIKMAKEYGFDSVLALSRARAISYSAFADESRYLLDPGKADTYEQTYLDKSLAVLHPEMGDKPVNLESYYASLEKELDPYTPGEGRVPFLGFFGDEAGSIRAGGQEADALNRTLQAYRAVQRNDKRIRELATAGDRTAAVALRMDREKTIRDFDAYDAALSSLTATHQKTFDRAIRDGDAGLSDWKVLPPVAAVAIAALAVAGVRPRLAEFR